MQQYNGVPLDGRAMAITLVDGNDGNQRSNSGALNGRIGQRNQGLMCLIKIAFCQKVLRSILFPGGNFSRGGRGRGGFRGRGRGRGRQAKEDISAEELDKQLDAYVSKMETD